MANFGKFSGPFQTFQIIWYVSMELKFFKFILKRLASLFNERTYSECKS